jgi:hypothetical protein
MQTRESKRAVPVGAKYKHSVGSRKGKDTGVFKHDRTLPVQSPYPYPSPASPQETPSPYPPGMAKTPQV